MEEAELAAVSEQLKEAQVEIAKLKARLRKDDHVQDGVDGGTSARSSCSEAEHGATPQADALPMQLTCPQEDDDLMPQTDQVLLHTIRMLCPDAFDMALPSSSTGGNRIIQDWTVALEHYNENPSCDATDAWLRIDQASSSNHTRSGLEAEVSNGVRRELAWYFTERTTYRIWGWRCDAVDAAPCVHTLFARHLLRFVESANLLNVKLLKCWCTLLNHVVDGKVFTRTKWLGRSKFERCLTACLVLLENLHRELVVEDTMQVHSACSLERSQLALAVAERARHIAAPDVPTLFRRIHHSLSARNPRNILGGFWCPSNVLACHESAMMAAEKLASAELGLHLLCELWAYWHGNIDGWTFIEDALSSACTAASFTFGVQIVTLCVGGSSLSIMDVLAREVLLRTTGETLCVVMSEASGGMMRKAIQVVSGTRETRTLRNAYSCLGL